MEERILLFIQENLRFAFLTPIMVFISTLSNGGRIWVIFTLLLLCFKKTRRAGLCSLIALIFMFVFNNLLIKNLVGRTRPYEMIDSLVLLVKEQKDFSFPSGHTASAFASAVAVYKDMPKAAGIGLLIFAAITAYSRLYVSVHYPTDVLGGLIIGICCGLIGRWLGEKIWDAVQKKKAGSML